MYGDTIVVWDWERDEVVSVSLREKARRVRTTCSCSSSACMLILCQHNACFDFLPSDHFAIAAQSSSGSGTPTPKLQIRRAGVKASLVNAFVEVFPTCPDSIQMVIAQRGSSQPSDVTVHEHYNSGYLSILPHHFLLAENVRCTLSFSALIVIVITQPSSSGPPATLKV
jgi:hypothetical protein